MNTNSLGICLDAESVDISSLRLSPLDPCKLQPDESTDEEDIVSAPSEGPPISVLPPGDSETYVPPSSKPNDVHQPGQRKRKSNTDPKGAEPNKRKRKPLSAKTTKNSASSKSPTAKVSKVAGECGTEYAQPSQCDDQDDEEVPPTEYISAMYRGAVLATSKEKVQAMVAASFTHASNIPRTVHSHLQHGNDNIPTHLALAMAIQEEAAAQLDHENFGNRQQAASIVEDDDEDDLEDQLKEIGIGRRLRVLGKGDVAATQPTPIEENCDVEDLHDQREEICIRRKLRALRKARAVQMLLESRSLKKEE